MNQKESANLAQEMAEFYRRSTKGPDQSEAVRNAIFAFAWEFLPEGATAAMIQRDADNVPIVVAIADEQLYRLEFLNADESGYVGSKCDMLHLKPGSAEVEVETRYRSLQTGEQVPARSTTWRFKLPDGSPLTIETFVVPDQDLEDDEMLARAIAHAMGWRGDKLG